MPKWAWVVLLGAAGCSRSFFHSVTTAKAANVADGEPPGPPTTLIAEPGSRSVRLRWTAPDGAQSFNLYWSTEPDATIASGAAPINNVSQPFTHNDLDAGVTYYYFVTATNGAGESSPSPQASAVPSFPPPCGPKVHPVALEVDYDLVNATLAWQSDATDAEGFIIYRQRRGFEWGELRRVDKDMRVFVDDTLAVDTRYSYRVTAFIDQCQTTPTNVVDVWTLPQPPSGFVLTTKSATELHLDWVDTNANENGYRVERAEGSGPFAQLANLAPNSNALDDAALSVGTQYSYRLFAQTPAGESAPITVTGRTTTAPVLAWKSAPAFEAQCHLTEGGLATFDTLLPGNTFMTTSASASHATSIVASSDGFDAALDQSSFVAPETLATSWSVTDKNGATSTLSRNVNLTVTNGTRSAARRPQLLGAENRAESGQALHPACAGNCTGRVASLSMSNQIGRTCYTTSVGEVRCMGDNNNNAVGLGWLNQASFLTPFPACESPGFGPGCVFGSPITNTVRVGLSESGGCVLDTLGGLRCFGVSAGTFNIMPIAYPTVALSNVTSFSERQFHGCAISGVTKNLYCWGSGTFGKLGKGDSSDGYAASPVCRTGSSGMGNCVPLDQVIAVSTGLTSTCAIVEESATRHVYCWGSNSVGQTGGGNIGGSYNNPQLVCATGTSSGTFCNAGAPIADPSFTLLASANDSTCVASTANGGAVWCWGKSTSGEVGNASFNNTAVPDHPCVGGSWPSCAGGVALDDLVSLSAGGAHFCAVRDNAAAGELWCWGNNTNTGALGTGGSSDQSKPARVCASGVWDGTSCVGGTPLGGASVVFAGGASTTFLDDSTCALVGASNDLYCWGSNAEGKLGTGDTMGSLVPIHVTAFGTVSSVSMNGSSTCVVDAAQQVKCVGSVYNLPVGNLQNVAHARHVCATGSGGLCSGGQRLATARQVSVGLAHSCALHDDGSVSCWGSGVDGQRGDGTNDSVSAPVKVCAPGTTAPCAALGNAVSVEAGSSHSCALLNDGRVACWGANYSLQLGPSSVASTSNVPVIMACGTTPNCPHDAGGDLDTVVQIATTHAGTCALVADGRIFCWGLFNGLSTADAFAVCSSGVPVGGGCGLGAAISDVASISGGEATVCAVLSDGTARCFGANDNGLLGTGASGGPGALMSQPVCASGTGGSCVPLDRIAAITVGGLHACALLESGQARCWGDNGQRQIGNGRNDPNQLVPAGVCQSGQWSGADCGVGGTELAGIAALSAGSLGTCAVRDDASVWCWGDANQGATGHGGATPASVAGLPDGSSPVSDGAIETCDQFGVSL